MNVSPYRLAISRKRGRPRNGAGLKKGGKKSDHSADNGDLIFVYSGKRSSWATQVPIQEGRTDFQPWECVWSDGYPFAEDLRHVKSYAISRKVKSNDWFLQKFKGLAPYPNLEQF